MRFSILSAGVLVLVAGCASHKTKSDAGAQKPENRSAYSAPLSTPGHKYSTLPVQVRSTILAETGATEIVDIVKEAPDGRMIYRVYFRDPSNHPPLIVGADGSVLNSDLTVAVKAPQPPVTIEFTDLPANVAKLVREREPEAEVLSVLREHWGERTIYIVSFRNEPRTPKLYIVSDGVTLVPGR